MLVATQLAAQRVHGIDAYDGTSVILVVATGIALLIRSLRRPIGQRGVRGRRLDELLVAVLALGLGVLALHQLVTDDICHGSCSLPLPSPSPPPSPPP